MTDTLEFSDEALTAAEHWHSGIDCKLYAIVSTGRLSRGTHRPMHPDEDRPMTDDEWLRKIADDLQSDAERAIDGAKKMLKGKRGTERAELLADIDGLSEIVMVCEEFLNPPKGPQYLTTKIVETKRTEQPRYGMARSGYTLSSGAPTNVMIRLDGESRWRRLMCWQFSNAGTLFVRVRGVCLIVRDYEVSGVK